MVLASAHKRTISIVTPSYNQGEFLQEAIQSVTDQNLKDCSLEYIIQDNCSSDATTSILDLYDDDESVHISVEADSGQADAINRAFNVSTGEILGWVNSDDVLLPGALGLIMEAFNDYPEVDVIYGKAYFIDSSGIVQKSYPTTEFDSSLLLNTCFLSQPSVFYRRSLFEKVGGLNDKLHYCLDYNLWIKFYLAGAKFLYLKKPLSATRIYESTKTATGGMLFVNEILQMLQAELGYIPTCWIFYNNYSMMKFNRLNRPLVAFCKAIVKLFLSNPLLLVKALPCMVLILKTRVAGFLSRSRLLVGLHFSKIKKTNSLKS
ncbi:MAG: glycosyltransferase family 2 protein [Candidatus Reddybacter sp.]